jgi:hypothetical protein
LCISRNKEKELDSKFGIGMEHLKDNPYPVVPVARVRNLPELFWDDDSYLGSGVSKFTA